MPLVRIDLRKGKHAAYRQAIGCAVYEDEYFSGIPDAPLLCRIDYTGRLAVKR